MQNNGETKSEWVLRELKKVKKKQEGKTYRTFEINIGTMASDCIDVIEDLNKEIIFLKNCLNQIQSLREEFSIGNPIVGIDLAQAPSMAIVKENEVDKISNVITNMIVDGAPRDEIARVVEYSMVVIDTEKLREQLRGDICE